MLVAGVDEVGQGASAGPLVVCAALFEVEILEVEGETVISTPCPIEGVKDSKKFSSRKRREEVARLIIESPALLGARLGVVPSSDINRRGMTWAWRAATFRAVDSLPTVPDLVLTDGINPIPKWKGPQRSIPKADASLWPVSAASILAKVQRDLWMVKQDLVFPGYDFSSNVGYATPAHGEGIRTRGVTPLHRVKYVNTWFSKES